MTFSLADVDFNTEPLRTFEGADLGSVPRAELLELLCAAGDAKAALDRLVASVAGEIASRSTPDDGPGGLARQRGFASPEQLVASVLGVGPAEGFKFVRVGTARAEDSAVGSAVGHGDLSIDKADLIIRTLAPLAGDTRELEQRLVRMGTVLDYRRLQLAARTAAARFDSGQTEEREWRQHEQRSLDLTVDAHGMTRITGQLGVVQASALKTFLDAQVKAAFQAKKHGDADDRTATQVRADALVSLAMHGLDCSAPATGVKATIIVRVDERALREGVGMATCDAIPTPISLDALRQLAVDASVLPFVMGANGQVLDAGREERLFSWTQRMALAERDGGCAKCHAPVSHCITHHIIHWKYGGKTDLSNGVLLCVRCHTQVHRDRWGIEIDSSNRVWFTPPVSIDPGRHRQLGGLAALALA